MNPKKYGFLVTTWLPKGQLISKTNFQAVDSPKNERTAFDFTTSQLFKSKKGNLSVRFFGESMAWKFSFKITDL